MIPVLVKEATTTSGKVFQLLCPECNGIYEIDVSKLSGQGRRRLLEAHKNNEDLERTCSIKCRMRRHNKSDRMREVSSITGRKYKSNLENYIRSEAFKEHLEKLNSSNNGFSKKHCESCLKETRHNGTVCLSCNPTVQGFNRDIFYSEKIESIKFEFIDKNISLQDIDTLEGITGVWAKTCIIGNTEICLDVSQTKDIGKEMRMSIRAFESNKNKSEDELTSKSNPKTRIKYRDMYNISGGAIIFKIVAINIPSKSEREHIEAQYAHSTKSLF